MNNHLKTAGFTLVEVMVVVAIVAILAAIAYPSYQDSIRKGRRNDGMNALLEAAGKLELYRARTGAYSTSLSDVKIKDTSIEGYYDNLTIEAGACTNISSCYTITIAPTAKGGQNRDVVTGYRLHSTGLKERNESGWTKGWK
jgi:type IV pilus assembly protein PilE